MTLATLAEIIRTHGVDKANDTMVVLGDDTRTFGQMLEGAGRMANALASAGVVAQDRVAFIDKNSIEYFEVLFGGTMINAVNVAVNWRLAAPEMAYIVNDANAKVLFVHTDFADQLNAMRGLLETVETIVIMGDASLAAESDVTYASFLDGQPSVDPGVVGAGDDVGLQLYTSGTTGHPKGAQITNQNFSAVVEAAASWAMSADSVNMVAMPLFHIGGSGWALFGMANGCKSIIMRELDPTVALENIQNHKISHAFLVPAALQFLLLMPTEDYDLTSMELMAYGASPITEDVLVGSIKQFGCDYIQIYGLTETTGTVTQLDPEDHDPGGPRAHLLRSAGKPLPGITLKIVNEESGETVPDGEVGEVWVNSPANMLGYWNLPEATAEALPGDGWFRSGDAGYLKEGYLFIHDRVKDMIVSGGENVYPAEIENVLMSHESVADVGVIGVPDDKWGETPKALVVLAEGCELDEAALIAHCRESLAGFKCPTSVETIAALPRNPSGKILKRELRAPYWEGRDRNV